MKVPAVVPALARLALVVALASGCGSVPMAQLAPVPRLGDGPSPFKAQVRHLHWDASDDEQDRLVVELDVFNADPARPLDVDLPRLLIKPVRGGAGLVLDLEIDESWTFGEILHFVKGEKRTLVTLPPGSGHTSSLAYKVMRAQLPPGPLRFALAVGSEGQPPAELVLSDTTPASPRWNVSRPPNGIYLRGGFSTLGSSNFESVFEPIGLAGRASRGPWVYGTEWRYTFTVPDVRAERRSSQGFSLLFHLALQSPAHSLAPYVEAGAYTGPEGRSRTTNAAGNYLFIPRVTAGLLLGSGGALDATGPYPFEGPRSPQKTFGIRVGLTHWFYTGEPGGSWGLDLAYEFGRGR